MGLMDIQINSTKTSILIFNVNQLTTILAKASYLTIFDPYCHQRRRKQYRSGSTHRNNAQGFHLLLVKQLSTFITLESGLPLIVGLRTSQLLEVFDLSDLENYRTILNKQKQGKPSFCVNFYLRLCPCWKYIFLHY